MIQTVDCNNVNTKPVWYEDGLNLGEPVWRFEHLGHTGQVVLGQDGYSARLDNSGDLNIKTADEAKALVEKWLDDEVNRRVNLAVEWLNTYKSPNQSNKPIYQWAEFEIGGGHHQWNDCKKRMFDMAVANPELTTRIVYLAPQIENQAALQARIAELEEKLAICENGTMSLICAFVLGLILVVISTLYFLKNHNMIETKSDAEKFLFENYKNCMTESLFQSKDECLVRVDKLSSIKGEKFKKQVDQAILESGLLDKK